MQLRRLIINGFKTFAGKSEFEFREGITAVVGPNGSGKSNLSDAVRWVLGEQSARILRGSSMSDVIFSGTNLKKPSSMAEVTAVIDNSDRALALDFDELSVTRRVYRDGESQFMINGVECRLKDITELFSGTGLGKEAYASIEQGKVDAIISSQPQDRRGIFDEASGIQRYKNRKREAERKLADVDERTERASEMLADLEEKQPSLTAQALDAERYKALSEESRGLELRLISIEASEAHLRSEKHEKLHEAKVAERMRLEGEISLAEAETEASRVKAEELSIRIDGINASSQAASRASMRHEMRGSELGSQIESILAGIASAKAGVESLEAELSSSSLKAEELSRSRSALEAGLMEAESGIRGAEEGRTELLLRAEGVEQRLEAFRAEHFEIASRGASARNALSKLKDSAATWEARRQRLEDQLKEKATELSRVASEQESSEGRLCELRLQEALRADDQARAAALIAEQKQAEEGMYREIGLLRQEEAKHGAILGGLMSLEAEMEGYSGAVKAVFAASKAGSLKGIIGTAGDCLRVPAGLELAIESALGQRVNDVICETADQASDAVELLKRSRAGRATFLPLDVLDPGPERRDGRLESCRGFIGYASDLVGCEPRLRPALTYLLGGTAVFETLDDAISSQRKGIRLRSVTREGELVAAAGAITGGQRRESGQSLLLRKARIRELEEAKAKLADELRHKLSLLAEASYRRQSSEKDSLGLLRELEEIRTRMTEESSFLIKAGALSSALSSQASELEAELAIIDAESRGSAGKMAELAAEIERAEADLLAHDTSNSDDKSEKEEVAALVKEASDRLTGFLVRKATIEADLRSVLRQEAEHSERVLRMTDEIGSLRASSVKMEDQLEPLRASQRQEAQAAGEYAKQAETSALELEELRKKRDEAAAQAQSSEQAAKSKRRRLQAVQDSEAAEAVETARASGEFAILSSKLQKDFGISFDELPDGDEEFDRVAAGARLAEIKEEIGSLGNLNLAAADELSALNERIAFMRGQLEDLSKARTSLAQVVREAERTARKQFVEMFEAIRGNFKETFARMFAGGTADIVLVDEDEPLESGIEIICRPPGKKLSQLSLLSGGEKALAAIALIFSFLKARPAPFCILDEIDAALDDANIDRFRELVQEYSADSQMIIISHRRRTMEAAQRVYGVTMEDTGISKAICVDISEIMFREGMI